MSTIDKFLVFVLSKYAPTKYILPKRPKLHLMISEKDLLDLEILFMCTKNCLMSDEEEARLDDLSSVIIFFSQLNALGSYLYYLCCHSIY